MVALHAGRTDVSTNSIESMKRNQIVPRGIRNRNPLNIRIGNVWLGEVDHPTDPEFEQFCTFEYGIRAGFIILRRYIRRYGHNTIRSIISHWAPSSENDTEAYITAVSRAVQMEPDAVIDYGDKATMVALVDAMILHECGEHVPLPSIIKGYERA